jgi:hypothetical protein
MSSTDQGGEKRRGIWRWYPCGTPARLRGHTAPRKCPVYLAPRAGFEPATNRLTAGCSTAELPGNSLLGVVKARI